MEYIETLEKLVTQFSEQYTDPERAKVSIEYYIENADERFHSFIEFLISSRET